MHYQCQRCGACCQWPGQVRVTEAEITALSHFLKMDEVAFIQKYTRLRKDRQGLALVDKTDGSCVFYEPNGCLVNPVKPQQCVDFPDHWNFPGFEKICKARLIEDTEN